MTAQQDKAKAADTSAPAEGPAGQADPKQKDQETYRNDKSSPEGNVGAAPHNTTIDEGLPAGEYPKDGTFGYAPAEAPKSGKG
jgi:hypothetical protein